MCLQTFGAKKSAIEADLDAKQVAEDYDACDALAQQLEGAYRHRPPGR